MDSSLPPGVRGRKAALGSAAMGRMRRTGAVAAAAVAALALVPAGGAAAPAPKPATPAAGRAAALKAGAGLFSANGCGACHTLVGAGARGAKAPDLDVLGLPAAQIVKQLTRGSISMPSFRGRLTTVQIQQLAAFVAATAKAKERRPRDAATLYRGYCGMCHTLAAAGSQGAGGPALGTAATTAAEVQLAVVDQHSAAYGFANHLEPAELAAIAAYVAAASPTAAAG